ncbi:effector-associated constant component EACC1 [Streptomyces sp. NPDC002690]
MRVRIVNVGVEPGRTEAVVVERLTESFGEWLARDRAVSAHAKVQAVRPDPAEGAMSGDFVEWLNLAVSAGFSSAALVYAHRSFRASLPPRVRQGVRMVVECNGARIEVEHSTEEEAIRIARALAGPSSEQPAPADPAPAPGASPAADAGR